MIAMLLKIVRIIESTPNDQELGEKIRSLFNNLKQRHENK
jgi:hypothetical protein